MVIYYLKPFHLLNTNHPSLFLHHLRSLFFGKPNIFPICVLWRTPNLSSLFSSSPTTLLPMSSYIPFSQSSSYLELLNSQDNSPYESFPPAGHNGASEIPPWSSQQSQDSPLSQETSAKKDRKKWNPADDEVLISAWLNTSKDPIIGNQQKAGSFWKRIGEYYAESPHAIAKGENGLNINCKQRWFKINDFTNKFCGAYATSERLNGSGHSETDVLKMAHDIYLSDHKTPFTMNHCWCLLRFEQKFLDLNKINNLAPKGRTKRKPVAESAQSEATHTEPDVEQRPPGVKAAKATRNNLAYYLTDGIYPKWATFIPAIKLPLGLKNSLFSSKQEAVRKDVERAFGVLQARFAVVKNPSRLWDKYKIANVMRACIILHNMIVEDERGTYSYKNIVSEFQHGDNVDQTYTVGAASLGENISSTITRRTRIRDKQAHQQLKEDLVEHIWTNFGHLPPDNED